MENATTEKNIEKLVEIERKAAYHSGLFRGILLGVGTIWLIAIMAVVIVVINKETFLNGAVNFVLGNVMEDVFQSFPDGYWTRNSKRIVPILDQFTNAASEHKISNSEYKKISRAVMYALKDRRLTYQEIENILKLLKDASINSTNMKKDR